MRERLVVVFYIDFAEIFYGSFGSLFACGFSIFCLLFLIWISFFPHIDEGIGNLPFHNKPSCAHKRSCHCVWKSAGRTWNTWTYAACRRRIFIVNPHAPLGHHHEWKWGFLWTLRGMCRKREWKMPLRGPVFARSAPERWTFTVMRGKAKRKQERWRIRKKENRGKRENRGKKRYCKEKNKRKGVWKRWKN